MPGKNKSDLAPSFVAAAAGLSALLGVVVLVGWAFDVPLLRSVLRGAVQMKANTAVGLVAAAIALWLAARPRPAVLRTTTAALSILVAGLGLATISQYLFGWNLGIDELLVNDTSDAFNAAKGRMSPYSAAAFTVLGVALFSLPYPQATSVARALAGLVLLVGFVSFLGYFWNASEIVSDRWVPPIAVNTACAFMLLGAATIVVSWRADTSPVRFVRSRTSIEGKVLGGFVLATLLLIIGGSYTYRSEGEFAEAVGWVTRTHEVRAELGILHASLADAESAQRNYILLGKPKFESEFSAYVLAARSRAQALGPRIQDPSQVLLFERLRLLAEERIAHLQYVTEVFETRGLSAARSAIATEQGIRQMEQIRALAQQMDDAQAELLRTRTIRAEAERRAALFSLLLTLAATTGVFAFLFRSIRNEMLARNAAEEAIQQLNTGLEQRVDERTTELSHERAFLRKVIDLNRSLIFARDREGRFVLANQALAQLYGTTVEALIGKSHQDFNPNADEVRRFRATDHEVIDSGRELVIDEEKITDAAGQVRWLHIVKCPIVMPDGTATMLLGVATDITARKAAEDGVRQLTADLERRVEERTADLQSTNAQLEQARLDAEQANRAKSAFLATMSHEIRTPMNGVIGMVEVLAQSRLDEDQRDAVQTIRGSSFTLLRLIDDVLDFSKIEAGRLDLERLPVHLAEMVEGLCRSLAPVAADKGVSLRVFVDPRLPQRLWADPTRLRQVLTNLVGNAIKFSGNREEVHGRVTVRAQRAQDDAAAWTLEVADNGIGMTGTTVRQLFTSFAQAETSTTRRFGGTGLGLAISHRLVSLMNGSIEVRSEPELGSTFTLRLPIDPVSGDASPPLPDLGGVDCLIVESADIDAADLAAYLEQTGATLHRVGDAAAAVAAAERLPTPVLVAHQDRGPGAPPLPPAFERAPNLRKVLLTAKRDTATAWHGHNIIAVDANGLGRAALLRAVAAAAGRASPEIALSGGVLDTAPHANPPPTIEAARASGRLILVAEDDAINRKVIHHQLGLLGYAAEIVDDGQQALEAWRRGGHALLLTDLHMPIMDGYTLTEMIRREEVGPRVPILALTANALRGEAVRARAAGVDEYLTKPMQLRPLGDALAKWLAGRADISSAVRPSDRTRVFDPTVLPALIGDDEELVRGFLADYWTLALSLADELRNAAAYHDNAKVAAITHKLKSSSRSVGALALGEVCEALEKAALHATAADVARHCTEFEAALAAVGDCLGPRTSEQLAPAPR